LTATKDGDSFKLICHDGGVKTLKCRFIDKYHIRVIGKYQDEYYICQYAELMERARNRYEPIPGQKPKLDILTARYGGALQEVAIPMTEAAIRKLVGGKYGTETLYSADGKSVSGAVLRGKDGIVVCGIGGEDNTPTSLHPYWAQGYRHDLSPAGRKVPEKPQTLLGDLADAKTAIPGRAANRPAPAKATEAR
jgi:hypothetical protein